MALINCPECGKEVSNKAGNCPNCGYPIPSSETVMQQAGGETDTSKVLADAAEGEEGNKNPGYNSTDYTGMREMDMAQPPFKSKKRIIVGVILGVLILLGIVIGVSISSRNAKMREQQQAEIRQIREYNEAVDNLNALYSTSYNGASKAESVCVLTINVWVNSIYNKYDEETNKYTTGTSDFNDAIDNVYKDEDIQKKLGDVKNAQSKISTYIQTLQSCPDELQKCYDAALQVHTSFNALAELALAPSGNITSYRDSEQQKIDDYVTAYNMLGALIPAKKEVPLYDSKGNKMEDEFAFVNYLNQNGDKLPDTVENRSVGGLTYYKGTATICGVEGEVSYNGSGISTGMIDFVKWSVENPKKGFDKELLEKLRERYGEERVADEKSYSWSNDETKESLLLNIDDSEITISWYNIM